LVSAS